MTGEKRKANVPGEAEKGPLRKQKKAILKTASSERPNRRKLTELNKPRSLRSSISSESSQVKSNHNTPKKRNLKKASAKRRSTNEQRAHEDESIEGRGKRRLAKVVVNDHPETSDDGDDGREAEQSETEGPQYWLMKAEPESRIEKGKDVKFSIDDLKAATQPEAWDGVRNYAARNNMRAMLEGDQAFFYHSNCKVPGIAGVMEVVREHSIDESAFDSEHPYYDEKSTRENPKWYAVHVEFRQSFPKLIKLKELQKFAKDGGVLEKMQVMKMSRLSVSKVTKREWDFIMGLVQSDMQDGAAPDG